MKCTHEEWVFIMGTGMSTPNYRRLYWCSQCGAIKTTDATGSIVKSFALDYEDHYEGKNLIGFAEPKGG